MRISEIPEEDRPREKLMRRGAAALTDAELLAIFLRTGRRGKGAVAVASELLAAKGPLPELQKCGMDEMAAAVSGIGVAKAAELCAAVELGRRLARGIAQRPALDSASAVYDLFAAEMQSLDREAVKIAHLNTQLRLLRDENLFLGTLNECVAHPREIFRGAIINRAYAILVIHNHPSGDPTPSRADHSLTRRLVEASGVLQVQLMDHIIIGNADGGRQPYFSFREAGVL